jgi:hypothetical protein
MRRPWSFRDREFLASKFLQILLRADWIAIILPLSAGLLSITGATQKLAGNRPVMPAVAQKGRNL